MPLASKETQDKRDEYQTALNDLLAKNINPATIMRALQLPPEQRSQELAEVRPGRSEPPEDLNELASIYDERQQLQQKRDALSTETQTIGEKIKAAGLDLERIQANRNRMGQAR